MQLMAVPCLKASITSSVSSSTDDVAKFWNRTKKSEKALPNAHQVFTYNLGYEKR